MWFIPSFPGQLRKTDVEDITIKRVPFSAPFFILSFRSKSDEMNSKENVVRNWSNWIEIPVEDFDRAQSFYETIFDITIQVMDLGALKMGIFPGQGVGCAICKGSHYSPASAGPIVYLNGNPDLDIVQQRITAAGGKILMSKKQISPEHGFMALFQDSEGNRLALHSNH